MTKTASSGLRRALPHLIALLVAAAGCFAVATWAKDQVETAAITDIRLAFARSGHDWADVTVDGLTVTLTGTAPDEATRFKALSAAGTVVDASRIIDAMDVEAVAALAVPDFSIEVLKNDDGISLIGLVPVESDPDTIVARVRNLAGTAIITDLLESAEFAPPPGWEQALAFGLDALEELPRSKVSIKPKRVSITAVAEDQEDKRKIERRLDRNAPAGLALNLNISAPLPVIAPFTLRFLIDGDGARFDACSADTQAAHDAILAAAIAAGLREGAECTLGLGTPTTQWSEAAIAGIEALSAIGQGALTISNADISLVAKQGTSATAFDRAIGELEGRLPDVFSLNAVLPEPPEDDDGSEAPPPEFTATLSPEGQLQLRGRLGDEATRAAVESFSAAAFGRDNLYPATRLDPDLPMGWPRRVLSALESLSHLNNGVARVTAETIDISGATGEQDAQAVITRILTSRLEGSADFTLNIRYSEALDPLASIPTADECIEMINAAAGRRKITFAPGSTDIESDAMDTVDAIAEILRNCREAEIEIGGHTDSQGREVMNEQLSQARADSVLNAIMARRVLVSNITAKGYGEAQPIADNGTEAGREANRRIEFRLITPDQPETSADGPEGTEAQTEEDTQTEAEEDSE